MSKYDFSDKCFDASEARNYLRTADEMEQYLNTEIIVTGLKLSKTEYIHKGDDNHAKCDKNLAVFIKDSNDALSFYAQSNSDFINAIEEIVGELQSAGDMNENGHIRDGLTMRMEIGYKGRKSKEKGYPYVGLLSVRI